MKACTFCGSTEGVRTYAITIDGVALHLSPNLCTEHGERFLIRVGMVLGELGAEVVGVRRKGQLSP